MKGLNKILGPSDPSTYRYTDDEWAEICKKDGETEGFTLDEMREAIRRNGIARIYSPLYVSSLIKADEEAKDDVLDDGWRN